MTLAQAQTKLKAARAENRVLKPLLIQAANQLSRRQLVPELVRRIEVAVNGGGK